MIYTQYPTAITRRHIAGLSADDSHRDTHNRKPYRTAPMKAAARASAKVVHGTYVSNAPRLYHRSVEE